MQKIPYFFSRAGQTLCCIWSVFFMVGALGKEIHEPHRLPQGVLVYARGGDAVSLDPGQETDGESLNVTDNIFESLLRFKPGTTEIEPWLAESWNISADGLVYGFVLRKNILFQDGTPFNADAVVFSWERQHNPNHVAHGFARNWGYWTDMGLNRLVKKIERISDFEVRLTLNEAHAPLLANLAMPFASIVSPTAVMKFKKNFARNPVGTGPFVLKRWTRGERILLDAHRNYWGKTPCLERIVFRNIPDPAARLNSFLAREVHVMNLPTPDQIKTIRTWRPDAQILSATGMNVGYLAFNTQKEPFSRPEVREAIRSAIGKQEIIDGVFAGLASIAVNPMPPVMLGYAHKVTDPVVSIKEARIQLAKAGYPNGFEATLHVLPVARPYMPDGRKVAEVLQNQLNKLGVRLKLVTMEWGMYLDKVRNGEHQMALLGWTGDNGDPDNFLHVLLSGDNAVAPASNISFYNNPTVNVLLRLGRSTPNPQERAKLYEQAQKLIHQDVPLVPLAHSLVSLPADPRVENLLVEPTGSKNFGNVCLKPKHDPKNAARP